jgi:hypothetical protein
MGTGSTAIPQKKQLDRRIESVRKEKGILTKNKVFLTKVKVVLTKSKVVLTKV